MANELSNVAGFKMDDATTTGTLTDISAYVNSVTFNGGNALVDDTGLGMARHKETLDIAPVHTASISGFVNTTTRAILGPMLTGWSTSLTIEFKLNTGAYLTGETYLGPVSFSSPIGLQTFSAEFRSNTGTGLSYTSTAAT